MTRFKELWRIERAIEHRDHSELHWAALTRPVFNPFTISPAKSDFTAD
jgi:hypothetical protein